MSQLAHESTHRLADLLRREHAALGDFLVALADFDRRRLWESLGHSGLFYFLHRELGLSRGAAHYRKVAAGLVQRFPEVVAPLRDGRLCITSVVELARVMTEENRAEVLPRFFHRSKAEARAVAVELRPEAAPAREVVTRVHSGEPEGRATSTPAPAPSPTPASTPGPTSPPAPLPASASTSTSASTSPPAPLPAPAPGPRPQVEPLTADLRRLHMTVSRRFLEKLEAARAARSHAQPGATAEEMLEAGLDLLLARQASRRGLTERPRAATGPRIPAKSGPRAPAPSDQPAPRPHLPAEVRREVWRRDQGRCTWPLAGGGCCGSASRLEIDHVIPHARGGPSVPANLRLLCRIHNQLAARQAFGDAWMAPYLRGGALGAARQQAGALTAPAPPGPPPSVGG